MHILPANLWPCTVNVSWRATECFFVVKLCQTHIFRHVIVFSEMWSSPYLASVTLTCFTNIIFQRMPPNGVCVWILQHLHGGHSEYSRGPTVIAEHIGVSLNIDLTHATCWIRRFSGPYFAPKCLLTPNFTSKWLHTPCAHFAVKFGAMHSQCQLAGNRMLLCGNIVPFSYFSSCGCIVWNEISVIACLCDSLTCSTKITF